MLNGYDRLVGRALDWPALTVLGILAVFIASLAIYPLLGVSFFPRTDAGQFTINLKAPTGSRIEITEQDVKAVENLIRKIVAPEDLGIIVSNIGSTPDFSALYTRTPRSTLRLSK